MPYSSFIVCTDQSHRRSVHGLQLHRLQWFSYFEVFEVYTTAHFSFPGTSVSLTNTSFIINGSLSIIGAPLEVHLNNASVTVSGDLQLEGGINLPDGLRHIAIVKHNNFIQGVLNISLAPGWSPSSPPINVTGSILLDPNSVISIAFPTNAYSGVAPIAVGGSSSLEG